MKVGQGKRAVSGRSSCTFLEEATVGSPACSRVSVIWPEVKACVMKTDRFVPAHATTLLSGRASGSSRDERLLDFSSGRQTFRLPQLN